MAAAITGTQRLTFTELFSTAINSITMALTIKIAVVPIADCRFISKWGPDGFFDQATAVGSQNGNIIFGVHQGGAGPYNFQQTANGVLVVGSTYRMVLRWPGVGNLTQIWVNGVQLSTTDYIAGNPASVAASPRLLTLGYEVVDGVPCVQGDYSEFAMWSESVPDWVIQAYGKGYSPSFYKPTTGWLYCPIYNVSDLKNRWQSLGTASGDGTNVSATNAAHPNMLYPSSVGS